jgi:drug/metabolite transporter (DMT)-like permease
MSVRLAIFGAALVILGLVNIGGHGTITLLAGVGALLAAAIAWAVTRRSNSSTRR